eukprot:CAMPEP_0203939142 /NCGR_PEP_ID=MMETSP0359-20131031/75987_1 /ASSEMBLY_ACC=CAM_ASM_000338 /TAXON_ID=268821 /ORGANISM="Scrippsiella Hangoei, Strain SHTV-5" /LENGTH=167 /DNA_ID=CAMNT_0050869427 /DNA_START=177 /DNA_END=679 /DNA_ORIENTATION=+
MRFAQLPETKLVHTGQGRGGDSLKQRLVRESQRGQRPCHAGTRLRACRRQRGFGLQQQLRKALIFEDLGTCTAPRQAVQHSGRAHEAARPAGLDQGSPPLTGPQQLRAAVRGGDLLFSEAYCPDVSAQAPPTASNAEGAAATRLALDKSVRRNIAGVALGWIYRVAK